MARRSVWARALAPDEIRGYAPIIEERVREFLKCLEDEAHEDRPLNMSAWSNRLT